MYSVLVKTKMIRIKKRGGGTRLQKVRVLASGKLRFMKNPKSKGKSSPKKTTTKRRSVRRTARKKRRRGKRGMTIPLAVVGGLAAGLAEPAQKALEGDFQYALSLLSRNYTGFRPGTGTWEPRYMQNGLLPLVAGLLVHKFVGGSPLNLNRALAASGIPFIRI